MKRDEPPRIRYGPGARGSDLPVRHAAAVVVNNDEQELLIVRRNRSLPEFPGVWSFASIYEREGSPVWGSLVGMLEEELRLVVADGRLLGRRMGLRPQWRILMHLYGARRVRGPMLAGAKYDGFQWVRGIDYFARRDEAAMGDCMRAYLDHLKASDGKGV